MRVRMVLFMLFLFGVFKTSYAEPSEAALRLAETERAFAKMSVDSGLVPAFLTYLHDSAVVFRPEPLNGKRWYASRGPSPSQLKWTPSYVEIAGSGDLGVSTGPWEYRSDRSDTAEVLYGHFVSIWRKTKDNNFRVMADLGISHDKIDIKPDHVTFGPKAGLSDTAAAPLLGQPPDEAISDAESTFVALGTSKGIAEAYATFLADDARVYREGFYPVEGKLAADSLYLGSSDRLGSQRKFVSASSDGDFGYTYGIDVRWSPEQSPKDGARISYLRVWRKDLQGLWKISLDIGLPIEK